ncbi:MAG: hypothetical protein RID42_03115 [Alphaproteobacteria bacterium]
MFDDAEQLDGEHRQHTWHDIENQTTEQGKGENYGERKKRNVLRLTHVDNEHLLDRPTAINDSHGKFVSYQWRLRLFIAKQRQFHRHLHYRAGSISSDTHLGWKKPIVLRSFHKNVGFGERKCRGRRDLKPLSATDLDYFGSFDSKAETGPSCWNLGHGATDQRTEVRRFAALRKPEVQDDIVQDTLLFAGLKVYSGANVGGAAGFGDPRRNRQDDLVLVSKGIDPEDFETARQRPLDRCVGLFIQACRKGNTHGATPVNFDPG